MRFIRGSKVEVMNKEDVLTSWRCAEIVSGNGHTYYVRYEHYLGTETEAAVARVSRKFIRPCPPPTEGMKSWAVGDIIEVFDDNSWKTAAVSKVIYGGEYYLVRLFGATQEFRVHKLSIRVRQSWQYDKWAVLGQGSTSHKDVELLKLTNSKDYAAKVSSNMHVNQGDNNASLQESHLVYSRTLKRGSPYCSSLFDANDRNPQNIRATDKGQKRQRLKVDAVTYTSEQNGRKLDGVIGCCSLARSLEPSDSDSDDLSSVGSCSVISGTQTKFSSGFIGFRCQDPDTLCSDAESFNCSDEEEEEEELTGGIHRLELHAYRCTLGVLYASGPLTWDKEALLTNLRISLHISNDEHLMELRNLISAGAGQDLVG